MNLLLLINAFSLAGAEKLAMDIGKLLSPKGNRVIIAAVNRLNTEQERSICSELQSQGIKTYILGKQAGKQRAESVLKICRIIRQEKIDILHAHCSVPMMIGKLSGFLCHIPVICTVHSTRGYSPVKEKLTANLVSAYVAIGKSTETYMAELGIPAKKTVLIYNGVDFSGFERAGKHDGFWADYGLQNNRLTLISVGRVIPLKNHLCFIKAVKRCLEANIPVQGVILGKYEQDDYYYCKLRQYIEQNNLSDYVRFLGEKENVIPFLANADCFVMPSFYEGLSMAFLEAVAAGLPVIVSDLPFVHEINEIAECASVFPQNDDAGLADVVINRRWFEPVEEARQKLAAVFSIEHTAEEHLKLYRGVLEQRK